MRFFEDVYGRLRPISAIADIQRGERVEGTTMRPAGRVELTDGETVRVEDYNIDRIIEASNPVIPAHPGYSVLVMWGKTLPADQMFVDEWPIVAWQVNVYGDLDPMVPDPHFRLVQDGVAILRPDGKVTIQLDGVTFGSREEWEAEMRERAEVYRAEAASKSSGG